MRACRKGGRRRESPTLGHGVPPPVWKDKTIRERGKRDGGREAGEGEGRREGKE